MGKILVLAEKPSVARDIAKVLGCRVRRDGYIEGERYIITWAVGHLVTLFEPEDYDYAYKRWKYQDLPILPERMQIKPYNKTKKQLTLLKKFLTSQSIDSIICATDSGREGELIFRYIYTYAGCRKPFQRLWISSMTDAAIHEGFNTLKDGSDYNHLYYSAKCRSEADWLVGINATRAYTTKNHVLLSIGRVQTPTLALIVDRQKQIDDFKPKDYWEVHAKFEGFKAIWFNKKPSDTKILDLNQAVEIEQKTNKKTALIEKITKNEKKQPPPLLYDLTELQRDGNKKYGYTAKKVLQIAQDLYEKKKLITYPRTDSRYLSQDMVSKVEKTLHKINVTPYSAAIYPLLQEKLNFNSRIINDKKVTDHHAIIPTDSVPNISRMTKEELNIYNLIVKRFIAVFYPYYIYETTEIRMKIEGEKFCATGKTIKQLGWKKLYKEKSDKKEPILPVLQEGESLINQGCETIKKQTKPPKPYTEATLLGAMENAGRFVEDEELKEQLKASGFGTPATRAGIIERLIQVGYIIRKGKTLLPTDKGSKLIAIVPKELKSPETTGKWEKGLNKIKEGGMAPDHFMSSIQRFVQYLVNEAAKSQGTLKFDSEKLENQGVSSNSKKIKGSIGVCPLCGKGKILENSKSFYCSEWKNQCSFTIWKDSLTRYGQKVNKTLVKQLLKEGKIDGFEITLPQTHEKCTSTLWINDKGNLELKNVKRVDQG